jgi:hypothetical protein
MKDVLISYGVCSEKSDERERKTEDARRIFERSKYA